MEHSSLFYSLNNLLTPVEFIFVLQGQKVKDVSSPLFTCSPQKAR